MPSDAPNRFVINIQPDQVALIRQRLRAAGIAAAPIFPMVRGRLIARNGAPVAPDNYSDERAQRLIEREFNLSYADAAPDYNTIVAGRWFAPDAAELSLEEGIAKTLGVSLGDELTFDIAGTQIRARVTSLRKVSWDSLRSNFFVIMSPRLLQDQPATFITSVHLPASEITLSSDLVREFPNLTVIDTGAILRQVQAVLDQVIAAVEFLFAFTLAAGVLVLYTALASSRDERVREAGLLRALGATQRQLARAQVAEMVCIGGLAGALAALGASTVGWALARYAFDLEVAFSGWIFLFGIAGGAACAVAGGWVGLRSVLRTPPLATLREA